METDAEIAARCTVFYRVCMEEEGITWQDCGRSGCGPPMALTREQIQAHALAEIPPPGSSAD
jgi:hypothetical protein